MNEPGSDKNKDMDCTPIDALALLHFKDKHKYKDKACAPIGGRQKQRHGLYTDWCTGTAALPEQPGASPEESGWGEEGVLRALYLEKEKKFALPPLCCWDILRGIIFKRAASRRTVAHFLLFLLPSMIIAL